MGRGVASRSGLGTGCTELGARSAAQAWLGCRGLARLPVPRRPDLTQRPCTPGSSIAPTSACRAAWLRRPTDGQMDAVHEFKPRKAAFCRASGAGPWCGSTKHGLHALPPPHIDRAESCTGQLAPRASTTATMLYQKPKPLDPPLKH
jgi:hypothetical protein